MIIRTGDRGRVMMNWIRKAPPSVLIAVITLAGVVTLAFLAGFVVLTISGEDTTEYRGLVNLAMNAIAVLLAAVAAVGGSSAARSASNTEEQSNGTLTAKDQEIETLKRQLDYARRHGGAGGN
jgi:hypothetical protein